MAHSIANQLNGVHPQMLRAGSETDPQKLAALKSDIGRSVERTLELLGMTKQEAAFAMGYTDQGVVSRWCSGIERPQFDKLFLIEGFEDTWLLARAKRNPNMVVETTVTIRRIA